MQSPPNQPLEQPQPQPQQQAQEQTRKPNSTINHNNDARPGTPPPPPYSPVTPVFAQLAPVQNGPSGHLIVPPPISSSSISPASTATLSALPPQDNAQTGSGTGTRPEVATETPPPVPIGPIPESDNPDVIALRSAISILQLQKQQSLRDMRALDKMKKAAAADPERFARELTSGNLKAEDKGGFINLNLSSDEEDDDDKKKEGDEGEEGRDGDVFSNLGKLPTPQNIVRMPPINWAKYQIVGEPLDKMHAEQLRRPSAGEPLREDLAQRAPEHVLASPYRPLVDKLESPGRATGAGRGRK